jgi:DNA-binding SARP family transcriptional activator
MPTLLGMRADIAGARPAGGTTPPMVCVLGTLRLHGPTGIVTVNGALPKALLALLASEVGRPVALDRLTDLLWGTSPPSGVRVAIQQLATRARRPLAEVGFPDALRAEPPGYILDIDPFEVDLVQFRTAMRSAFEAARAGDDGAAVAHAASALALWSGRAFADLVELPVGAYLGPFLDDERWRTEELRATSLMNLGRADEAARLLASATAEEPLRERLWVLQSRALADAGQVAEAVRCARTGVAVLASELGIPAGPELAELADRPFARESGVVALRGRPAPGARDARSVAQRGMLDEALRRALANAERAAQAAMTRRAHGEAVHQWLLALDLIESGGVDDDHRMRVLLGLGEAYNQNGNESEGRSVFLEAAAIARRRADSPGLAWAALGYCHDYISFSPPPEQEALMREAFDALDEREHLLRSRLLARLAREIYWTDATGACRSLAKRAFAEALLAGDAETRLLARYSLAFGSWQPDRVHELVDVCEAYLGDAIAVGDRFHELLARRWLVPAVSELGDVARGGVEAEAAMRLADELGISVQQWITRVIAGAHQLLVGDLALAEQLGNDGLALGAIAEPGNAIDYVSMLIWTLRWMQGRLDEIASLVEEVAAGPGLDLPRRLGLAVTYAELGRRSEATAILDSVERADVEDLHHDASWYVALAAAAEAAALAAHRRVAEVVLDQLTPYRDRIGIASTTATGPVAHHIGLCAWVLGDTEGALAALGESIEIADRCGTPAFGARSRLAMAERLARLGRHDEASALARAARDGAARLGMRSVARDAEALLAPP